VVVAECVWVLESFYAVERWRIAEMMRSALDFTWNYGDMAVIRALELYETIGVDFVDAYVLGLAEYGNHDPIVTFDRELASKAESVGVRLLGE
jgi:predicted nucleic-acid-binding protein